MIYISWLYFATNGTPFHLSEVGWTGQSLARHPLRAKMRLSSVPFFTPRFH